MLLREMRPVDRINAGTSDKDAQKFGHLTENQFDAFRFNNYCPACGWERSPQESRMITPVCPRCGASWDHTSIAAGAGGPEVTR